MKIILFIVILLNLIYAKTNTFTPEEKEWIKNNTISVGIEEAKPYIYYNNYTEDIDGLYSDIFKLVLEKSNLKTIYVKDSWSELLNTFKNKELDLLPATFYSKERESFGLYSDPYYQVREYIYIRNNSKIHNLNNLKNKKVAIVKSYATIKKLKAKYPSINIVETNSLVESITMLLNNEVDALIDYHLVVDSYIRDHSIIGLKALAQSELDSISVHYLSNIEKPILHSILQKSLKSITRLEMNELLKKWLKNPYDYDILTSEQKKYLQNNTFNVYANDWEPFTIYDENKKSFDGLSVDIWKKIVDKTGINYEFVFEKHFLGMLEKTKNDKNGIIISTSKTADRAKYAEFSIPYSTFPIGIATQIGEKYIINFKDLEGKTIAVGKNYTAHKLLKKHYKNIKFVTTKNTDEALKLLAQKKVFAAAEILPVLIDKMNKHNYTNLKISGVSNIKFQLEIMVNKQSEKLIDILNKAIENLEQQDEIRQINNRWITKTRFVESVDYSLMYKILIPIVVVLLFLLLLYLSQKKSNQIIQKQKKALKNLNDRYELTLEAVEDGIWDWDLKTNHLYFSKNWALMLGYKENDLDNSSNTFFKLLHKDDHEPFNKMLSYHLEDTSNNKFALRIRLKCKNGEYKWILTRGKAFLDLNNKPKRMLGYHTDITDELKSEEHIKTQDHIISEQAKLAAMGEMIGNIAHQWRQPLSVITTGATSLKFQKEYDTLNDKTFEELCDAINDNAQYLSKTIDDFRNFIKGDRNKVKFNLSETIQHFLSLVNGSIKTHDITIVLNNDEKIELEGYPNELIQCFMNLYNNAKDALVENMKENKRLIFISSKKENDNVEIKIKDNAGGIPSEVIDKIFEPYFTTKPQSLGTGIGLSMTYGILIDGMNGTIKVENVEFQYEDNNYKGAEFTITLPID